MQDSTYILIEDLGMSEDWAPQQPEPTADCDEADHYGCLATLGACPYCTQDEVPVA